MEDKYFESTIIALEANHKEFTAVNLAGHDLKGDRPLRLANALAKNTFVDTLELHEVQNVSEEGWERIASSLPAQLHTLDLSQCGLDSSDIFSSHISPALSRLSKMSELDLSGNNISLPESFFSALSGMSHLSELLLQHNKIGNEGAIRLMQSIHPSAPLSRVWLQNNEIQNEARSAVEKSLSESESTKKIQIIWGS